VYNLLRRLVFAAALVATAPLIFITWLEGVVTSRRSEKLYGSCKELLASVPTFFGEYFRGAFYWAVCAHVETGVVFLYGSMVAHRDTTVRRGAIIGCHSIVGYADIGPDVMLAARVSILSGKYQHGRPGELRGAGVEPPHGCREQPGEHTCIRLTGPRVPRIGDDLEQRDEREGPLPEARMRHFEVGLGDDQVAGPE